MIHRVEKFQEYEIYFSDITTSTNDDSILEIDEKGFLSDKKVFTAEAQTSGSGRNGRKWDSEKGNLFFSLIVKPIESINSELLTYVAAISVQKVFEEEFGLNAKIKWPNDIILSDKKISGILLKKYKEMIIIGIGVNIISHPDVFDSIKATSLKQFQIETEPKEFLKEFLKNFTIYYSGIQKNSFEFLRKEVLKNLYKLNQEISFKNNNQVVSGVLVGIDEQGRVMIQIDNKAERFSAGEIFDI